MQCIKCANTCSLWYFSNLLQYEWNTKREWVFLPCVCVAGYFQEAPGSRARAGSSLSYPSVCPHGLLHPGPVSPAVSLYKHFQLPAFSPLPNSRTRAWNSVLACPMLDTLRSGNLTKTTFKWLNNSSSNPNWEHCFIIYLSTFTTITKRFRLRESSTGRIDHKR